MNTSVFYINGLSSVYYNLEQAIKEAKLRARCAIISNINYMKDNGYDTRVTNKNIEDCILKYRVTVGAGGNIKVRATAYIPYSDCYSAEKKKNVTFSKTYTICTLSIEKREKGTTFELPFSKKQIN